MTTIYSATGLTVTCPQCRRPYVFYPNLIGNQSRCPDCQIDHPTPRTPTRLDWVDVTVRSSRLWQLWPGALILGMFIICMQLGVFR